MPDLPSLHAAAALLLTVATFALFASGKMRIELICLLVIATIALGLNFFPLPTAGRYTGIEVAFGGFGHEALVAICCLMIIGRGLVVTGALEPAARLLAKLWRFNGMLGLLCTLLICMFISGFINDTPVLVLALPIILNLAQRVGISASQTLMPVNSAILIGGMATTIGTSTNVLVISLATDLGLPPIGLFEFADIVAVAALVALPYLWLIMPRLLPKTNMETGKTARRFRATLHLVAKSTLVGKTAADLSNSVSAGLSVLNIARRGQPVGSALLEAGDDVLVDGTVQQLRDASDTFRAPLAPEKLLGVGIDPTQVAETDRRLAEIAIGGDSTLVGKSVRDSRLAERFGLLVVGTYRAADSRLFARAGRPWEERLDVGDLLLVQGTEAQILALEREEGIMQLADIHELPRTSKAPLTLLIVASVVFLAAFKIVPIAIAALAGSIAMLATGCVRYENIGRALSVEVIVLIAASIALGRVLVETGAADWLAAVMAVGLREAPSAVVVGSVLLFAAVLTNFVSNAAAAAIGTPLAMSLAAELSLPAEPLVLAILFGCNLCYVTPMAYQTNLLIMSAAGYQFKDFVRAGTPLAVIMIITLAYLLVQRYGL